MGHGCVMGTVMMFVAGSGHGEGCHHSCHRGCRRPVDLRGMVRVNGAEMLRHPCILGGPQQRRQNQKSKPTLGVTMMLLVSQSVGL